MAIPGRVFGPIQQQNAIPPAYSPSILNYMQGITFESQSYISNNFNIHKNSFSVLQTFLRELTLELGMPIRNEICYISGGFATIFTLEQLNDTPFSMDQFNDIDIYCSNDFFQKLENLSLNSSKIYKSGLKTTPNYNLKLINFNNKIVQFINMNDVEISKIVDSFDLSICKCWIDIQTSYFYYDSRLYVDTLVSTLRIDHLNGVIGKNRTFERLHKYIDRYHFKNIHMGVDELIAYGKWTAELLNNNVSNLNKENDSVNLELPQKEMCVSCNEELKWIHMQLRCPNCKKVYAG